MVFIVYYVKRGEGGCHVRIRAYFPHKVNITVSVCKPMPYSVLRDVLEIKSIKIFF